MRKLYSFFLLTLLLCASVSFSQISVTASAGAAGPTAYTTLKAAFDAVNNGTHLGAITISINGNTTETTTASLNASGAGAASYTAISINSSGAFSISGNVGTSLISFNGARNVNLNGNNTLQLINTHATAATVLFTNDATGNTIRNTIIKGATAASTITAGVVTFGTGTVTGNDNNIIDNCEIDGGNAANCLIFSKGTTSTTSSAGFNSGNIVRNCKLHDYINPAIASAIAINISTSTGWTIRNNNIYQTVATSTSQQFVVRGIVVLPDFTSDAHIVRQNMIGGSNAAGTGTMSITATATNVLGFIGIDVETGGANNFVDSNTVSNVTLTYAGSAGSFSNAGIFGFIGGFNGLSFFNSNTVSNINISNTAGFISFSAIHLNARVSSGTSTVQCAFDVSDNAVNNIVAGSGGAAGDVLLFGLRLETSSAANLTSGTANPFFNATRNNINNLSTTFTGVSGSNIRGIGSVVTQGTSSTAFLVPALEINNNTIHTITSASGVGSFNSATNTFANYAAPVVVGIQYGGSSSATNNIDTIRINNNTIFNLNGTNTGDVGAVVTGIMASTGTLEITGNKIRDLKNQASGAAFATPPGIVGINVRRTDGTSNSLVANNFISLGTGVTNNVQVFGVLNNFANATGPLNIYYNSVVITGSGAAGNNKITAAYHRGTETQATGVTTPVNLRNNILYNERTGGGAHYAIVNTHSAPATGFTSAYNNLYSANAATIALWGSTANSLAAYATNATDATSKSVTVNFVNVANGDLHLSGASIADANLKGLPIAGITTDIDGDTRNATTPTMGADEGTVTCVAPSITTQPAAQAVCLGGNATFTVTAAGTAPLAYQWRKDGANITGATSATYTINNTVAGSAGNYDVVITNACGNVTSSAVALSFSAATAITTQPTAQTACTGSAATFTVSATGAGALTYQWRKNGTNITGATLATYSIAAVAAGDAGNYDVVVTGACGSVTTTAVALTVNASPSITTQPTNQTACTGASVSFTVAATGTGLTYQWRKGGTNITGATSATYIIASAAAGDAGNYDVVITGTCGNVTSNSVSLNLNAAPVINTQPVAQVACTGGTATFTVAASGSGLTYQWRKGGVNITGATSATLTLNNVSATDAANYDVVISTSCATSVTSNAVALTVNTATTITTQPAAQQVCAGSAVNLTVVASGTGLTYQWRKNGTNITGATSATYNIAASGANDAGNYDVVVTGTCGNVTSTPVAVTVNGATLITTQPLPTQTICAGATASFTVTATGTGLTYQWRKGGVNITGATSATYTIASAATGDAGNYDVVVTGTCGNITSTAVALTVTTGGTCTTAIPNIDADVTESKLMPNVINSHTVLRVDLRRNMRTDWVITDASGRVVTSFSRQMTTGRNDINLSLFELGAGIYTITGTNAKGRVAVLRFVKL